MDQGPTPPPFNQELFNTSGTQTSQSPRYNDSVPPELTGQYVVLMDNSIPSFQSTLDTDGVGGVRRMIDTENTTTPKKSEQPSPQSLMFPVLPGNSHRYTNETDSIKQAEEIIVDQGLPEIERNRFSSTDRPVLGFGVDHEEMRSKTVAQERDQEEERKPLHSYFQQGRRTYDPNLSESPPSGIGGLLRENEKEAKKRQTFFQTSGRFTETTQISEDMEMLKTMRSRKPQMIETIRERSSHGDSAHSGPGNLGSSMKSNKFEAMRALSPIELRMPSRKERQYVNQLMNMEKSWMRQQEQIYRLEKKIKEMESEQEDERERFKQAIETLKIQKKRLKGPLKSIKKKAEEKDKFLREGVKCLRINEKVIHNREVTVKDMSKQYKLEKKKAKKLQRELEIKDRVHKYINQRIEELEQEEREKEAILGPYQKKQVPEQEGNQDLALAPTPYN